MLIWQKRTTVCCSLLSLLLFTPTQTTYNEIVEIQYIMKNHIYHIHFEMVNTRKTLGWIVLMNGLFQTDSSIEIGNIFQECNV